MWALIVFIVLLAACVLWIVVGVLDSLKHKTEVLHTKLDHIDAIAQEVLEGKWGYGDDRKHRLDLAGYNPKTVQKRVNELVAEAHKKGETSMTCKEKLRLEHPERVDPHYGGGCYGCPGDYNYITHATMGGLRCSGMGKCAECWGREVENEPKTNVKGETVMDTNQQLISELLNQAIAAMKPASAEDRKAKYKEPAEELWALYNSLRNAGFDNQQAFQLVLNMTSAAMGSMGKSNG